MITNFIENARYIFTGDPSIVRPSDETEYRLFVRECEIKGYDVRQIVLGVTSTTPVLYMQPIVIDNNGLTHFMTDLLSQSFDFIYEGGTFPLEFYQYIDLMPIGINNVLTNVTTSNTASSITPLSSYTATLTADIGYFIQSVSVTMGGVDITNEVYDADTGVITIASVTATLFITAVAVSEGTATITSNLIHTISVNELPDTINKGEWLDLVLESDDLYDLTQQKVIITMGGEDITRLGMFGNTTYSISFQVNGDIEIYAESTSGPLITNTLTGIEPIEDTTINYGETYDVELELLPNHSWYGFTFYVTMGGVELPDAYNPTTHHITISEVTADVIITAVALENHTFTFNNASGTIIDSVILPRIDTIEISLSDNTRIITINGVEIVEYTELIPALKTLRGLALSVTSSRVNIPIGREVRVDYGIDTAFYEIFTTEISPTATMEINLYVNKAESQRVDKTDLLTYVDTLNGVLRESTDIVNPRILIEYAGVPNFNYVYIPNLYRYYYVTTIRSLSKDIWIIELHCDVLMTYKDTLYEQDAYILRNESDYDEDLVDSERAVKNTQQYDYDEIASDVFDVSKQGTQGGIDYSARYVLSIVKGETDNG